MASAKRHGTAVRNLLTSARPRLRVTSLYGSQLLIPLCGEFFARLIGDLADIGKLIAPFIGAYSLNDHAGVMPFLTWRNNRIERPAPGSAQNVHMCRRVSSSAHRPHDFVQIGDVDVFINNHNIPAQISASVALAGDQSGLLGMAGITLLNRYDDHEPLGRRWKVDTLNIRHTGLLHSIPDRSRAQT